MEKWGNLQRQMGNVSGKMENLGKNKNEILKKCFLREKKNSFDALSRMDIAEEQISELEYMINRYLQNWKAKDKTVSKNCGTATKDVTLE